MTDDKASAYTTLYTVLVTLAKLTAPYTPFVSEMIYQNLVPSFYKDAPLSVHLCKFPEAEEKFIDKKLEDRMDEVLDIVVFGKKRRKSEKQTAAFEDSSCNKQEDRSDRRG